MIRLFANYLGMSPAKLHSKYLGLPMVFGSNRMGLFKGVEEKMCRKVLDWKNKMLSWAGREVLIKSCLQSMPLYAMGCLKFHKSITTRMSGLTLDVWWNGDKRPKECTGSEKMSCKKVNYRRFGVQMF